MKSRSYPKPKLCSIKNHNKYLGDPYNIISRSSWETKVIKWMDTNENVIEWNSEEVIVMYLSPVDGKYHRYFVDFFAKIKNSKGEIKSYLIEVKPYEQTLEPEVKKRITKNYINEVCTWGINSAKWKSAKEYCRKRGWEFLVLTEKEMFGK